MTTRRTLLLAGGAAVLAGAGYLGYTRFAGTPSGGGTAGSGGGVPNASPNADVDVADLMEPGPLGEMVLGDEAAPVAIIEYASTTCGHCANFHRDTYPALKERYVDAGRAKLVFREFPLDPVATASFMIARCIDEDKYFPFLDALFAQQRSWAYGEDPLDGLFQIAKQTGFTQDAFGACLQNQSILDGVNWVKNRAQSEFNVQSTPTFFINGEMVRGNRPLSEFESRIDALLSA